MSSLSMLYGRYRPELLVFLLLFSGYAFLAWLVSGGETWWNIGFVSGVGIYYGDDAYRFFLARSLWLQPLSLFAYNFNLPLNLLLENLVVSLAGSHLLNARLIHAFLSVGALFLFWQGGLKLGISRSIMLAAMLVLGCMPLYVFVSLSFYGEAWLAFALCLLVFLFAYRRIGWLVLVAACLPLIRPEGIFYLFPVFLYLIFNRRWIGSFLVLVPGGVYLLFLLWYLPTLDVFVGWREALRGIYDNIDGFNNWRTMLLVYSPLLTVPALFAVLLPKARYCWPLILGAIFYGGFLLEQFIAGETNTEPRYLMSLAPMIVLFWAFFAQWFFDVLPEGMIPRGGKLGLLCGITLLLIFLGFSRLSMLHAAVVERGWSWTANKVINWQWKSIYQTFLPEHMASYKAMSKVVVDLTRKDSGIDRVVMFDNFMYYFVDPYDLPRKVSVEYPAAGYLVFHQLTAGQVFTQHPGGVMYSYLNFGVPSFEEGERRALYVDLMPMPTYPYRWELGPAQMYLLAYEESFSPPMDLYKAPSVDPNKITEEYKIIFGL